MKKLFTDLSKCYSAIIVTVSILMSAVSVSAEEYKSMIRYDRVWECYSLLDGKDNDTYKCMRFDGTEEINGKIYHRIVTFKKRKEVYDQNTGSTVTQVVDCLLHEGYMREEDGKVFTLIEDAEDSFIDEWGGYRGRLYIPDSLNPKEEISECLLYDFNLDRNETYDAVSFVEGSAFSSRFSIWYVSDMEIAGDKCRIMHVCKEDQLEYKKDDTPSDTYLSIAEGVGAISKGCLNYHEFIDWRTGMYAHNYFTCLYDMDGNVLYTAYPDDYVFDYGSFASVDGINEESEKKESAIYDILGRRITKPDPGQLYIQGGRKHLRKAEK